MSSSTTSWDDDSDNSDFESFPPGSDDALEFDSIHIKDISKKRPISQQTLSGDFIYTPKVISTQHEAFIHDREALNKESRRWLVIRCLKLLVLCVVYGILCLVEIIGGARMNCMSLVFHGVHRATDAITYFVGLVTSFMTLRGKKSAKFSFGFERAEVVGALTVTVIMMSSSVMLFFETIPMFVNPGVMQYPLFVLVVSAISVGVDLGGILLLAIDKGVETIGMDDCVIYYSYFSEKKRKVLRKMMEEHRNNDKTGKEKNQFEKAIDFILKMNKSILALIVHLIADSISSIFAIVVSVLYLTLYPVMQDPNLIEGDDTVLTNIRRGGGHSHEEGVSDLVCVENCWVRYIDPGFAMFIACLMFVSVSPLIVNLFSILMEGKPRGLHQDEIIGIIEKIPNVISVQRSNFWALKGSNQVCMIHLLVKNGILLDESIDIKNHVKLILHEYGVHYSSVQLNYEKESDENVSLKVVEDSMRTTMKYIHKLERSNFKLGKKEKQRLRILSRSEKEKVKDLLMVKRK